VGTAGHHHVGIPAPDPFKSFADRLRRRRARRQTI